MFSSGTEYEIFLGNYCFECGMYKTDKDGMPVQSSCKIEKAIAMARFDETVFPHEQVFCQKGKYYHTCTEFITREQLRRERKKPTKKPIKGQITMEVE